MSEQQQPGRSRGRPVGEPTADVHLLLPVTLLAQVDALRGDVPRLVLIRRILTEWVDAQHKPGRPRTRPADAAPDVGEE